MILKVEIGEWKKGEKMEQMYGGKQMNAIVPQ